ncbi:MAG: MBL fold metallo-hydrolase [Bacteroidaceae bacterium]|nr:MBL fold metallo-hydrolase [Bacteroidaceae bacterium]
MKLTYIFHSGFVLETERCVLVFDYWMDPAHVMDGYMGTKKHVYVFASHFHEDHFTKRILKWRDGIGGITYILSKDILKRRRASREDAQVWMAKGAVWEDENVRVIATGSNDSGVSWIVEIDDTSAGRAERKRIFHAGDLCNWYARFLSEDKVPERVCSDEFGDINPVAEEKRFLGELKDVARLMQEHCAPRHASAMLGVNAKGGVGERPCLDLVMFPVDGRIGNGYTLGGRQFIERFEVGTFVPMHFVASGFESAWRMEPFCKEKGIPFWCIKEEGESIRVV